MTDLLALELLVLAGLLCAAKIGFVARNSWKLLLGAILIFQALALLLAAPVPPDQARPILGPRPVPAFEGDLFIRPSGHRIFAVAGAPVETLSDLRVQLRHLPKGGVAPLRAMDPGADAGARTVLLWEARLGRREGESAGEAAARALQESVPPESPRLALPPWGIAAPVLGLPKLPSLFRRWSQVPKQYYAIDVAPLSVPGYLPFRLASLLTSLAISLLLARGIRSRKGVVLLLALLLEAAALFTFP